MFWYHLTDNIEAFHLHLITTTYGDIVLVSVSMKCWRMVLNMVQVILRELWTVRAKYDITYGYDSPYVMVGKYLWVVLQDCCFMEEFLLDQFRQNLEVLPHINLYIFGHRKPRTEVQYLRKKLEVQSELVAQLKKT